MRIGEFNELLAVRQTDNGVYLTDGAEEILLPKKYVSPKLREGETVRAFVYTDSEDRPVATFENPKAVVGEFAYLQVLQAAQVGAFVDWGLAKDLLVPFAEQRQPMVEGKSYVVRVTLDPVSKRVVGSTKLKKFLDKDVSSLEAGRPVDMLVYEKRPDAMSAILNNRFAGTIYPDEIFGPLHVGDKRKGFIKNVREDGRVSVSFSPQGYQAVIDETPKILEMLAKNGGFLPFSDSSSPEAIRRAFGISKGSFKKILGALFKQGRIEITYHGIRLKD